MKLTNRESEITKLMSEGLSNKEIANQLKISIKTVQTYIRKVYIKLNARNKSNAVAIFLSSQLNTLVKFR